MEPLTQVKCSALVALSLLVLLGSGCGAEQETEPAPTDHSTPAIATFPDFTVFGKRPHPADSFTQGFEFLGNRLFESTGLRGKSRLRELDPDTGDVIREASLKAELFGEGLTYHEGFFYQLTWTSGKALRWSVEPFEILEEFTYTGQGWGLASDGEILWMSNGSSQLQKIDPDTFSVLEVVDIVLDGKPLELINELEWVEGLLLANIWGSNVVVAIDPDSGKVLASWDLSPLWHQLPMGVKVDVLNGLAWHQETKRLWVTGKLWPFMFEIELAEFPSLLPNI